MCYRSLFSERRQSPLVQIFCCFVFVFLLLFSRNLVPLILQLHNIGHIIELKNTSHQYSAVKTLRSVTEIGGKKTSTVSNGNRWRSVPPGKRIMYLAASSLLKPEHAGRLTSEICGRGNGSLNYRQEPGKRDRIHAVHVPLE